MIRREIIRHEDNVVSKGKELELDIVEKTTFTDSRENRKLGEDNLKIGVEYEYGIVPLVEIEISQGRKELKSNEKAIVWSPPATCFAKLPIDVLKGKGEGEAGSWGLVTLAWKLPVGLERGCSNMKLTLTRNGVVMLDDATRYNGYWEDNNVSVGKSYDYTLSLEILGMPMGVSHKRVNVEKLQPPPQLSELTLKRSASGTMEAQWDWPSGVDSCIWGTAKYQPKSLDDLASNKRYRLQCPKYCKSIVTLPSINEGEQWIAVFGVRGVSGHEIASAPIVLCISKTLLRYKTIGGRVFGVFGRKIVSQLLVESSTGFFPEIEIRVGDKYDVLSGEGRIVPNPAWSSVEDQGNGWWKKTCPLDGVARKHEYIKIFLKNPEKCNCDISPEKCEVR